MGPSLSPQKVAHLGRHVALPEGCPLRDPAITTAFQQQMQGAGSFSQQLADHAMDRPDAIAWLHQAAAQAKPFLRPWVMEILFVLGAHKTCRFGDIERGLGISSKVLASRLKDLIEAGHITRRIEPTTPVTIEYELTKVGRATAALASPLFAHLNLIQG
ncbi:MAG: winged helix-turn-helix transcriptional regulator [Thermoplasmatota archaeon]